MCLGFEGQASLLAGRDWSESREQVAFQLSVGSNEWFLLPRVRRGMTGDEVGKVIWGQIVKSPKFQNFTWGGHVGHWRVWVKTKVVQGRLGDSSSGHIGWDAQAERPAGDVCWGWNRKWQWESRVESVHIGDDWRGRTFSQLTFFQVKMVQDLRKRS